MLQKDANNGEKKQRDIEGKQIKRQNWEIGEDIQYENRLRGRMGEQRKSREQNRAVSKVEFGIFFGMERVFPSRNERFFATGQRPIFV